MNIEELHVGQEVRVINPEYCADYAASRWKITGLSLKSRFGICIGLFGTGELETDGWSVNDIELVDDGRCKDGNCAAGYTDPHSRQFVAFAFCPVCGKAISTEMLARGAEIAALLPTDGPEHVQRLDQATSEEGGPTKENLVLSCMGYATRALDHWQAAQEKQGNLPLLTFQLQVLTMLATDCAVMAAKQVAIAAVRGDNLAEYAQITEEEANAIALGQLRTMLAGAKVAAKLAADYPTPDETA